MKKRILFVIPYLVDGGAERALSNITNHFPDDWEIHILVNNDKIVNYSCKGEIFSVGIEKEAKTDSVWFQFCAFLKRIAKLRELKKKNGYLACISFLDSANVANILTGKKGGKIIVSVRSSLNGRARLPQYRYIANPLVRLTYNKADYVIAVSQGIANELIEQYGIRKKRVRTIENGYDLRGLRHMALNPLDSDVASFMDGKKNFITSGRLSEEKGQWHLIRAFSEITKQRNDVGLIFVGDGPLRGYLEELVNAYHIKDKVLFTGFTANPYKIIQQSDVFVLPSLFEGFPNSLAEAMCLGIPCIATDFLTGARELLCPTIVGESETIYHAKEVEYGILSPLCSGKMYSGREPLEEAEQQLLKAMNLMLDPEINLHYCEKSLDRGRMLDIAGAVEKWIDVSME